MIKRTLVALCLTVLALGSAQAEEEPRYVEGEHYQVLATPLKTSYRGEEIGEIMEFFSFNCIHCYNFEEAVHRFVKEKPDNIRFTQVPVIFNERQMPEAAAYYQAKLLKLGDEAIEKIFKTIHVERKPLRTTKQFENFFKSEYDITDDQLQKIAFSLDSMVRRSVALTGGSKIGGTPTIIANGKYVIDSGKVGGNEMALYVAKWLIEQDAKAAE